MGRKNAGRDEFDAAAYRRYLAELGGDNGAAVSLLKANLRRAVEEELSPRQRQTVRLYYLEGLTMSETAERLGVTKSTVSRTLARGRARLRRCLRYSVG